MNHLFLIQHHIVAQVIETKFVIRTISDITRISFLLLGMLHTVQVNANRHAQEVINLTHLLTVTLSQIVIDRNNVYTFF
ncbi:hypothetical protein D3C80_1842780 [compost metagenome]